MGVSIAERRAGSGAQNSLPVTQPNAQGRAKTSVTQTHSIFSFKLPWQVYVLLILASAMTAYNIAFIIWQRGPTPQHHAMTTTTTKLLGILQERDTRFKVESESVVYDRYARVYSREVRFPTGRVFAFDIWGRVWKNDSFAVVAVVPFDRKTQTFTLVREYNPAHMRHVYSFPQGMVEHSKHPDVKAAAAAELEEEAHLRCQQWIPLFHDVGVPQDKYQREVVFFYLCADAVRMKDAAEVDDEEEIEIVHGVTLEQVRELALAGVLQSNNIAAGLMAIDRLRQLRLIPLHT